MLPMAIAVVLAQLPDSYVFVHPVKLGAMVVVFAIWALFAQWVDKDTIAVNTFRILWNLVMISSGGVALVLLLFLPSFAIALPVYLVIIIAASTVYVLHRNGLVKPEDRVFTITHFKRLAAQGFKKKKQVVEVTERVQIKTAEGSFLKIPTDDIEREQYRLTQDLLFDMLWRRASVVAVSPAGQVSKINYEIDGIKTERESMPRADADAVLLYMKQLAGLDMEERRKPQLGKIQVAIGDNKVGVVVRSDGSTAGEQLTLQVIGDEINYKKEDLGFTEKQLEVAQALMEASHGLVLLSGPASSGLTTTVYSMTRSHDAFLNNIQTLEYQREVEVNNITQHVFVPDPDDEEKTFYAELQKIIRSDPDIIVMPQVREAPVASLACKSAAEKQKVYVGIAAQDVFEALHKWMKVVNDNKLIAKSLLAVTNQRMVRVLCTECKQPYKPDPQLLRKMNMPADKVLHRPPEPQYDKHGNQIICQNCQGSGYVGRSGVFDVLVIDDGLRKVITAGGSIRDIQSYALKRGGVGLQQQALQKVLAGTSSIQEVARVMRAQKSAARGKGSGGKGGGPGKAAPKPKPKPKPTTDGGKAAPAAR